MDLIASILLVICISFPKIIRSKGEVVTSTVVNNNIVENVTVSTSELKIGTNLMLRKEPRAYHRILDELGLK